MTSEVLDQPAPPVANLSQKRLFEVGGASPTIVKLGFRGGAEGVPCLRKGAEVKMTVHGIVSQVAFVDKHDSDGNPETTTRKQVVEVTSVVINED